MDTEVPSNEKICTELGVKSVQFNGGYEEEPTDKSENEPHYNDISLKDEKDVDEMIIVVGEYGIFQKLVNFMLCLLTIPTAYHLTIACFLTNRPDWTCVANNTRCTFNGSFPSTDDRRCGNDVRREDWRYTTHKHYSVQTDYDIVCDKEWLLSLSTTLFFLFWIAGAIVMGWVADNYGRKIAVFLSTAVMLVVTLLTIFMPNFYLFMACRCIVGFFGPGTFPQMFILISEMVGEKQRPLAGILIFVCSGAGCGILGLKAYLLQNWIYLSVAASAPFLPMLLFSLFIPESIRFLRVKGKLDKAHKALAKMAKWNKREIPSNYTLSLPESNVIVHKANPLDLFRTRGMAIKTLVQGFAWFACGMTYVGLYLAAQGLDTNLYLDYELVAVGEIIGVIVIIDLTERIGRKLSVMSTMLIGSVVCVALDFVPKLGGYGTVRLVMGMFGKATLAASFDALHTWSVELYPANIRGEGMGFMQVATRVGTASSPWIADELKKVHENAPFVTMGLVSLVAFFLMFYLQETKGVKTCDVDIELEEKIQAKKKKQTNKISAESELQC